MEYIPNATVSGLHGKHILLVEDNAINQKLAIDLLHHAGIRVSVANDGREAVAELERRAFDGVLMDCQMPVLDGFEATRLIRACSRWHALPIIAMSANALAGDRELALAAGMNDYITKPIKIEAMYDTISRWVGRSKP